MEWWRNRATISVSEDSLPSMDVYHLHCERCIRLSATMRPTKVLSPPGVMISTSAPVQIAFGLPSFPFADRSMSALLL
jgi:hypothetical protein